MKKSYDYILFDWDGCLARTLDLILRLYREGFAEFDLTKSDEELISIWGDWHGPIQLGISEEDLPKWIGRYKDRLATETPKVDLYENASRLLQNLSESGKQLALLSSSEKSSIEPTLDRENLRRFFSVFLSAEDVEHHKPHPEVIEKALQLLGGVKEKTIIIGDSKSDIGAAKNAGIDSLLYYPKQNEKFYSRESLLALHPTYVVDDFDKVLEMVN